jgi:hypothetical protein
MAPRGSWAIPVSSAIRFSGWASGGALLGAGIVGAIRAYGLMSAGHDYRDANFNEDSLNDGASPFCRDKISSLWSEGVGQALRWTHVGLLAAGESLYIGNALTGIDFIRSGYGGGSPKSKLHRLAFFLHGALMAAEAVMGVVTSDALRRGDHGLVRSLGVAHAAVGLAIPTLILGAGAIMELP